VLSCHSGTKLCRNHGVAVTLPICYGCINEGCIISRLSGRNLPYSSSLHFSGQTVSEYITKFAKRKVGVGEQLWCILTFPQWKPTRCTISQIYLIKYSTCFGQVRCPSSGVSQHCIHAISICHASSLASASVVRMEVATHSIYTLRTIGVWKCNKVCL